MSREFDVIVVGGGLTGSAFALACAKAGLSVALVESREPELALAEESWDSRIYAISPGSARFLEELAIWPRLPADRLCPVTAMHIRGDQAGAALSFDAYEAGVGELAWIVESRLLQRALWQALTAMAEPIGFAGGGVSRPAHAPPAEERGQGAVTLFVPVQSAGLVFYPDAVELLLADGRRLSAGLIVGADGARSRVRDWAQLTSRDKDYRQLGVVANFACERPHGGIARQWFRDDGILAWLPLPGNRISMVWSTPTAHGEALLALPAEALAAEVAAAGGGVLGRLACITPARDFPLHLIQVDRITRERVALIGDAAHQVHPLAGQGVNLGFGDARMLSRVLAARGERDVGDPWLLRRYERARAQEVIAMQAVTDGLKELFESRRPWLVIARNLGLALTDRVGAVKQGLTRVALGV
jgi:ubiquinone biosynthesis UbiH/UbiF/VisC/COQ6 family hydroxylase